MYAILSSMLSLKEFMRNQTARDIVHMKKTLHLKVGGAQYFEGTCFLKEKGAFSKIGHFLA